MQSADFLSAVFFYLKEGENLNQNWIVENLNNAFSTWNGKLGELWGLVTTGPQTFKGGAVWSVMQTLHNGMVGIGYGRFFRLYMYTALAPLPLAAFAGESTQSVGISFLKSYVGVCLEGAVIVLACVIYSAFVSTPTVTSGEATTIVWSYLAETVFNMLVLVGLIKGSDRIIHEMMGL